MAGVGLAATLPQLLVALPAGVATDRAERRRMMAGAATLGGAALATLAVLLGAVSVDLAVLDVVAFVVGSAQFLCPLRGRDASVKMVRSEPVTPSSSWS